MYQGAIFDLDGTILDSMHVWRQVDVDFLGKRGLTVPADYVKAISAMGFDAAAGYTIERFGFLETKESIIAEWQKMACDAYAHTVRLKPGAKEFLTILHEHGIKIAAATASDACLFVPALKQNGIYELFDAAVTVQEVARGKGFPDVYEEAARRMGLCAPDCIVFEDILKGIEGAKKGGFTAIAIYDEHAQDDREEIQQLADRYIYDFRELIEESEEAERRYGKET